MKNLAFVVALWGILNLLLISNLYEPPQMNIGEISYEALDNEIKIVGISENVRKYDNDFATFYLNDGNKIQIICNCPTIESGKNYKIIGTVTKYNNKLQVEADSIEILI